MDLEWLFQTIRTMLVVRVDFEGGSADPYRRLRVEIVGAREDDDGPDPFHIQYVIGQDRQGQARNLPLSYTSLTLSSRETINAFLAAIVNEWSDGWRVPTANLLRTGSKENSAAEVSWRTLQVPNLHFLLIMSRVQGALDEYCARQSTVPSPFALQGALDRLTGLLNSQTRDALRPMRLFTQSA